ncbi:hypothetical protein CIHG_03894 [Coccidioides immitis H538.4]|uniref:Ubiquitin interaction domain-containing protein n=1 Tax=Coccidioides immitis H538.4 TaxID=396776 RepID=A0A0J8RNE4_COCIT|nr:hypothetical protein CIHG_03894 [Coccidioides immitis H538.4]
MTSVPSEDAISEFVTITNATRDQAIRLLQAHNLDANRAANAFYESVCGSQAEGDWPASSEPQPEDYGYQAHNVQKSFEIERGDTSYTAPPSRPPSRVGRDPVFERARAGEGDGAAHYPENTRKMTLEEREEHDVQKAVAASLNRNFDPAGQETGVISVRGTHFGPANRDHYDSTSWAVTPYVNPKSKKECINPDPEERKRDNDQPPFLRPLNHANYLAACITILHAIPLSREAFISRDTLISDYGYHPQWWDGARIDLPAEASLIDPDKQDESPDELFLEMQRLMAFLDGTDRAFGSAEAVASILSVQRDDRLRFLPELLERWEHAAFTLESRSNVFESVLVKKASFPNSPPIRVPFALADITFDPDHVETLYDVIDTSLWPDTPESRSQEAWLEKIAPVFVMRLAVQDERERPVGVKIPATWYPDRYMELNKDFTRQLRTRRLEAEIQLENIETLIDTYSTVDAPHGQKISVKTLLENAITGTDVALKGAYLETSSGNDYISHTTTITPEECEKLVRDLKIIAEKVDRKLAALHEKKQHVKETLKQFSRHLTFKDGDGPPYYKYTLRGVCTHEHVMYVLKRVPGAEALRDTFPDMTFESEWQWWRISYSVDDAKEAISRRMRVPVTTTRIDGTEYILDPTQPRVPLPNNTEVTGYTITPAREIEVLRAAKEENSSVLLVYASDDAVHFKGSGLPEPLQSFLNADNESFESEILQLKKRLEGIEDEDEEGEEEDAEEEFIEDIAQENSLNSPKPDHSRETQLELRSNEDIALTDPEEVVESLSNRLRPANTRKASIPAMVNEEPRVVTEKDAERASSGPGHGVPPAA